MTTLHLPRRSLPALLVVALTTGLLSACGSSSSSSSSGSSSVASASSASGPGGPSAGRRGAFRQCLQQHGVTLPPRPPGGGPGGAGGGPGGPGGGGLPGGPPPGGGLQQRDPKLAAAVRACGGFRRGGRFRLRRAAVQQYVTCVRQHGYNLPNPNFSGRGPVFPATIRTDPKFQAASRACQALLTPPPLAGGSSSSNPRS